MLFEMIDDDIKRAYSMKSNDEFVCLEIFHLANRHTIISPILINEEDGIYVTDGKGNYYNLRHFADIEVKIGKKYGDSSQPSTCYYKYVGLDKYNGFRL